MVPFRESTREITIKRSRFIATLRRIGSLDEMKTFQAQIKCNNPRATHHCWAVVAGPPGETIAIGMGDDGEPKGTAGRPIFNVLRHSGRGQTGIVVTRYFGGIKLGSGGLVRAYTKAAAEVMAKAKFVTFSASWIAEVSAPRN